MELNCSRAPTLRIKHKCYLTLTIQNSISQSRILVTLDFIATTTYLPALSDTACWPVHFTPPCLSNCL